jgi:pimeloyl-ACP methyl ester carboxylesterase
MRLRASWLGTALTAVGVMLFLYLIPVGVLLLRENGLVYQAEMSRRDMDTTLAGGWRRVLLHANDGTPLDALLASPDAPARATVIYFHGNAASIWSGQVRNKLVRYQRLGYRVLALDYRGYGINPGSPNEARALLDAEAAVAFALDSLHIPADSLILHGMSLGSGIAAAMAVLHPPRLLILDGAYTSLPDVAAEAFPFIPVRLLMRNRFNTLARLDSIRAPILVVHAVNDEVIPFHFGETLAASTHSPTWFLRTAGGHVAGAFADPGRFGWTIEGILTQPDQRDWGWWGP